MSGTVDQFEELLVFEAVYDAETSLARARRRKGPREIRSCQARCKGFPLWLRPARDPSQDPADEEADV